MIADDRDGDITSLILVIFIVLLSSTFCLILRPVCVFKFNSFYVLWRLINIAHNSSLLLSNYCQVSVWSVYTPNNIEFDEPRSMLDARINSVVIKLIVRYLYRIDVISVVIGSIVMLLGSYSSYSCLFYSVLFVF